MLYVRISILQQQILVFLLVTNPTIKRARLNFKFKRSASAQVSQASVFKNFVFGWTFKKLCLVIYCRDRQNSRPRSRHPGAGLEWSRSRKLFISLSRSRPSGVYQSRSQNWDWLLRVSVSKAETDLQKSLSRELKLSFKDISIKHNTILTWLLNFSSWCLLLVSASVSIFAFQSRSRSLRLCIISLGIGLVYWD